MRFFAVLVIASCVVGFSECFSNFYSRKRIEGIMLNILDCNLMEDAVVVDMKMIFDRRLPKRYIDKCLVQCLGQISGIIKDHKIDPEGVAALANKSYDGNQSKVEIVQRIASACSDVTDKDRCEAAGKIFSCMQTSAESKGISIENL